MAIIFIFALVISFDVRISTILKVTIYISSFAFTFYWYLNSPKYLYITNEALILKKIWGVVILKREEIIFISKVDKDLLKNTKRLGGSGGLFGYFGHFKNKQLGSFMMYITNFIDLIMIKTNQKTFILNCDRDILYLKN